MGSRQLQATGQLPTTKNYLDPDINSAEVEKPWQSNTVGSVCFRGKASQIASAFGQVYIMSEVDCSVISSFC